LDFGDGSKLKNRDKTDKKASPISASNERILINTTNATNSTICPLDSVLRVASAFEFDSNGIIIFSFEPLEGAIARIIVLVNRKPRILSWIFSVSKVYPWQRYHDVTNLNSKSLVI